MPWDDDLNEDQNQETPGEASSLANPTSPDAVQTAASNSLPYLNGGWSLGVSPKLALGLNQATITDCFDGNIHQSSASLPISTLPDLDPPGPIVRAADWRDVPLEDTRITIDDLKEFLNALTKDRALDRTSDVLCNLIMRKDPTQFAGWLCSEIVSKALEAMIPDANPIEWEQHPYVDPDWTCHLLATQPISSYVDQTQMSGHD